MSDLERKFDIQFFADGDTPAAPPGGSDGIDSPVSGITGNEASIYDDAPADGVDGTTPPTDGSIS